MSDKRIKAVVEGYVQGVGYRWFTMRTARRLGLTGWVRNNPDRTVETAAEGDETSLMEFIGELRKGPMSASVRSIEWHYEEPTGEFTSFDVTY